MRLSNSVGIVSLTTGAVNRDIPDQLRAGPPMRAGVPIRQSFSDSRGFATVWVPICLRNSALGEPRTGDFPYELPPGPPRRSLRILLVHIAVTENPGQSRMAHCLAATLFSAVDLRGLTFARRCNTAQTRSHELGNWITNSAPIFCSNAGTFRFARQPVLSAWLTLKKVPIVSVPYCFPAACPEFPSPCAYAGHRWYGGYNQGGLVGAVSTVPKWKKPDEIMNKEWGDGRKGKERQEQERKTKSREVDA